MKRKGHKGQAGFSLLQILLATSILLMAIVAGVTLQKRLVRNTFVQHRKESLQNILEQRLVYFGRVVRGELGNPDVLSIADFIRRFATTGGDVSKFNPLLNQNPNSVFGAAFPGVPNPEMVNIDGAEGATIQYGIQLKSVRFAPGPGLFQLRDISFGAGPQSTLNEVSAIIVTATGASNTKPGEVRATQRIVISL